tara:strand:+ start:865 stop:1698 length:834 start_codon:yes stop_codon:yes gene_type:complete
MATYESRRYAIIPINATQIADGSVSNAEFQTVDTSSSINTQLGTKVPLAGGTMTGALAFGDNVKSTFGTGADLEIFHDSNNSIIKNGTGTLKFLEDTTEFKNNADNSTFLSISSSGVTGDFISGQTSTSSANSTDEIILRNGSGNIRKITIANAALQGPAGSPGSPGSNGGPGPTGPPGPVPSSVTDIGAIQLCYYDIFNSTASISRGSTTSGANLKVVTWGISNNIFDKKTFSGSAPAPAGGSAIGSGTWLALTGTTTGNVSGGTQYGPGLFVRIS